MPEAVCSAFVCPDLGLSPVYGLLVQRLGWPRPDMSRFAKRFKGRPGTFALAMAYNWTNAAFLEELFLKAFLMTVLASS
jgi:hypothetical protein